MPTSYAAPVLKKHFAPSDSLPPVWPDPKGTVRGESLNPLYKAAVTAAANDPEMYSALALIDAIRGGNARERELAAKLLTGMVMRAAVTGLLITDPAAPEACRTDDVDVIVEVTSHAAYVGLSDRLRSLGF